MTAETVSDEDVERAALAASEETWNYVPDHETDRGRSRRLLRAALATDRAARQIAIVPGSPEHVAIWDAINEYAESCGGDTSRNTAKPSRMRAVAAVERAIAAARGKGAGR